MSVTACLITWKRQNIPRIIKELRKYEFINEILIRDNEKAENVMVYGRYMLGMKAANDIIYTQDDDVLVHNIDEIYKAYDNRTLVYGTQAHMTPEYYGGRHLALMGWGSFFNREWIKILNKYVDKYGKDDCFYRETDRIFTMLLGNKHNPVVVEIEHLEGYNDENALCQQKDHLDYKKLAIDRCLTLV